MKMGARVVAVLGLLAAMATSPASAQDESGIYLGGAAGYTHWTKSCENSLVPCDDKDTGWRLFGGYRFNRWWAAEIGYFDLGAATGSGPVGPGGSFGTGTFEITAYGWDVQAVVTVPVAGRLSAFGKLGLYQARTTIRQHISGVLVQSAGDTSHNYTMGAGLQLNFGRLAVQAGWQRYNNVGEDEGAFMPEDRVDFYSVGVLWQF